jgi:ribosome-binding ATPase YchF (GTP1/OBG family)
MRKVSGTCRFGYDGFNVDKHIGKATRGYDPSVDIEWLRGEIVRWVLGNLMERWYVGRRSGRIESNANYQNEGDLLRGGIWH